MAPRPTEWTGLSTPVGFERCVRATVRELYGYVALLAGRDRGQAERQVIEVYRSLFRAARAGQIESVTLGSLRGAGRRIWLDERRSELDMIEEVRTDPASSIDALSSLERAVIVFRHVNGMSIERAAEELHRTSRVIAALDAHAVRRLRGTDDTSGAWLRAYFGPSVSPSAGLVDRVIRELGTSPEPAPAESPLAADDLRPTADGVVGSGEGGLDEVTEEHDVIATADDVVGSGEGGLDEGTEEHDVVASSDGVVGSGEGGLDEVTEEHDVVATADDVAGSVSVVSARDGLGDGVESSAMPVIVPMSDEPPLSDDVGGDEDSSELPATDVVGRGAADSDDDGAGERDGDAATSEMRAVTPPQPAGATRVTGSDLIITTDPSLGGRRGSAWRWIVPIGALLVAALALGGAWLLRPDEPDSTADAENSDGDVAESTVDTTATSIPGTTTPETVVETVPPTTPEPAEDVIITGETSERFDPPCTSWIGGAAPEATEPPDAFAPLTSEPSIVAAFPTAVGEDGTTGEAAATVDSVGGGLLVQLRSVGETPDTMLAEIAFDGTLRWVRCYSQPVTVLVTPNDDVDLAVGLIEDDARVWYKPSLLDGSIDLPADPVTAFALDILADRSDDLAEPGSILWDEGGLFALGPDDDIAWTDDTIDRPDTSATVAEQSDGIAVVSVCPGGDCSTPEVRGYDVDSGVVVWSLPGFDSVAAAGDGYALVGHPDDGWDLVETAFGDPVEGQHWADPDSFAPACCPDGAAATTDRFGGVVVTIRGGALVVWLPEGSAVGRTVDLTPVS